MTRRASASPPRRSASACACSPTTCDDEPGHLINPVLKLDGEAEEDDEGCLSLPGLQFPTPRAPRAIATGFNMYGEPVTIEGTELLARCVQHETDHLDGVLFIDRLDKKQRKLAMKAIREAEWSGCPSRRSRSRRTPPSGSPKGARRCGSSSQAPRRPRCPRCARSPPPGTRWRRSSRGRTRPPGAARGCSGRRWPSSPPSSGSSTEPARPNEAWFLDRLRAIAPDCCPVTAYGALLPQAALDIPAHGWVNLHFSVLPAWRGAAPVQHAVLRGDDITGATTFRIVKELDAGPVFGTLTEPVRPADTSGDLLGRLAVSGAELLVATLDGDRGRHGPRRPAARRRRELRAEAHPGRRPRRLEAPRPPDRPPDPRLHPRPRRLDRIRRRRLKLWPVTPAAARPGRPARPAP